MGVTHCVVGGEDGDVGGAWEGVGVFGQLGHIREAGLDKLRAPLDGPECAVLEVKTCLHRLHTKKLLRSSTLSSHSLAQCLAPLVDH